MIPKYTIFFYFYSLECEILAKLLKAFIELRKLKFLPTLALIYGAHTRLTAWESTLQNREVSNLILMYQLIIIHKLYYLFNQTLIIAVLETRFLEE